MPAVKPDEEACPFCNAMVAPKRNAGVWEFTCRGTHATGESLTWTWEGQLGADPVVPSWEQPPPLTAAQLAKKQKADEAAAAAAAAAPAAEPESAPSAPAEPADAAEPVASPPEG